MLSHRRLKNDQTIRPIIIARNESRTPRRLLGDGPIMLANSRLDSIESLQRAKSLLATPAIIPRAIFSAEGNHFSSSAIDPVMPSNYFVNLGFDFCSLRNAGEIKFEGNIQLIVYLDVGPESRRASILSVSVNPRTAHFEAFVLVSNGLV